MTGDGGAVVLTVHAYWEVADVLPAGSVPRTSSVCGPSPSPENVAGLGHGVHAAPSRLHSYCAPALLSEKVNVAAGSLVMVAGASAICTGSGATVSTVTTMLLVASLPAGSVAVIAIVCAP